MDLILFAIWLGRNCPESQTLLQRVRMGCESRTLARFLSQYSALKPNTFQGFWEHLFHFRAKCSQEPSNVLVFKAEYWERNRKAQKWENQLFSPLASRSPFGPFQESLGLFALKTNTFEGFWEHFSQNEENAVRNLRIALVLKQNIEKGIEELHTWENPISQYFVYVTLGITHFWNGHPFFMSVAGDICPESQTLIRRLRKVDFLTFCAFDFFLNIRL